MTWGIGGWLEEGGGRRRKEARGVPLEELLLLVLG
jgi:hypothetical protein